MKIVLALLLLVCATVGAQENNFEKASFEYLGKTLPYRILKPVNFDATKKYPLHLFLHGAGERGSDNEAQLLHGSNLFIQENEKHPAIIVFPQCPEDDYWAQTKVTREEITKTNTFHFPKNSKAGWAMSAVMGLLDSFLDKPYVDTNRVYLGGLSMGGMGTFELLARRPNTFASATAICGGANLENIPIWAEKTPIWIFHGDADRVVPSFYSKAIFEAVITKGIEPRFSLYKGVGHDSWTNAFAEPDLFDWIYSHKKDGVPEDLVQPWTLFTEKALLGKYKVANEVLRETDNSNSIVFMGDSITEGWQNTSPEFWEQHPEFINRGYSGHTTSQMLLRFRQEVLQLKPKAVVILAGTNDIAGNTGDTALETIANNIYSMADLAQKHDIRVIIASILPAYDYPWKPGLEPAGKIVRLNEMLSAFAKENNHKYLDFHSQMKDNLNGLQERYTYDKVHCTKEGYLKMEAILSKFLRSN